MGPTDSYVLSALVMPFTRGRTSDLRLLMRQFGIEEEQNTVSQVLSGIEG